MKPEFKLGDKVKTRDNIVIWQTHVLAGEEGIIVEIDFDGAANYHFYRIQLHRYFSGPRFTSDEFWFEPHEIESANPFRHLPLFANV